MITIKKKCECQMGGNFPLAGEGFSRRNFLRIAGTGLVASYFTDVVSASLIEDRKAVSPTLHNTARNCILLFLSGAPSHVDMWDLKEGAWTPASLAPTSYGETRWPQGLLPRTAEQLNKIAVVRSGLSWAAVHPLAQAWAQISRNPGGATGRIAPHIGAVVALESQAQRKVGDILPGFVAINQVMAGSGYLSAQYAPFGVQANQNGLAALTHPDGAPRLQERYALLGGIDDDRRPGSTMGRNATDMASFYGQAKLLIDSPEVNGLFTFTAQERGDYGSSNFGDSLIVARNLLAANKGTRFVQVTQNGWDHHANIYGAANSMITLGATFDRAYGRLLTDLSTRPGSEEGKTLLDETLVVILAEFGRTTGPLNAQLGRDHFLRMSYVFAGGGVRGGRIVGRTDDRGADVREFGWSPNRDVRPEDVTCSIYSALGIDYTTVRRDDPLGRGFEYVPFAKDGTYQPVNELF